jgi:2,4-dienoyl-CoA reductase-like NADH-dependent reductase (Old Yellow Enzyme family)
MLKHAVHPVPSIHPGLPRPTADRTQTLASSPVVPAAPRGDPDRQPGSTRVVRLSVSGYPARTPWRPRRPSFRSAGIPMAFEPIFRELTFPSGLTVKNRVFRSNVSGRFDNYDGSGNQARINWETKFARGGVGAVISSFVPVSIRGRIIPNYATIDSDDKIPFWRAVGESVHRYDCRFILQLSHAGRQQDMPGVENQFRGALSSTSATETFHGLVAKAMTIAQIRETIEDFAQGARRARRAGLDGVELHGANGYLFTQFLSSAINDRKDEYGGSLENRARFVIEVVRAIRREVGPDFHLQMKISAVDDDNALFPWQKRGNRLEDSIQVCRWLAAEGVDAFHVSTGSMFPHPRNPMGDFPIDEAVRWYDPMLSSGVHTHRNYFVFRSALLRPVFKYLWHRTQEPQDRIEGANLSNSRAIRDAIHQTHPQIPVICTGGFQTGAKISEAIERGDCDAVSIARPLIANNDLVNGYLAQGREVPQEKRCTYCNRCLMNVLENPMGCYELSRFDGDYDAMIREVMTVYEPKPFPPAEVIQIPAIAPAAPAEVQP